MASKNRILRVATICQDRLERQPIARLIERTMERLEWAAAAKPEIVCLPECWAGSTPEPVPGPTTERLAAWAQTHSCYVICPMLTRIGTLIHNSAVLIDPRGGISGRYDKIHPTEGEMRDGISPALDNDPPVFETEFGRIGIQICFDVNWPAPWARLKEKGAQIIFWPSAYPAGIPLPARAVTHQVYVVSATQSQFAAIYDITGRILDRTGIRRQWAEVPVPLGKRIFEIDYQIPKTRLIEKTYGSRVRIEWCHDSDWFTLASLDPDLTVEDLVAEFELIPQSEYLARCEATIVKERERAKRSKQ